MVISSDHEGFLGESPIMWETSDVSESQLEARCALLFENDPNHCWVDIYRPEGPQHDSYGTLSGEYNSENLSDPDYIGRCSVPFCRVYKTGAFTEEIRVIADATSDEGDGSERSSHTFFMIRQKNSWSRLFTNQGLLEHLLGTLTTENRSLPNILTFGVRNEDTDVGGPQLWYTPQTCSPFLNTQGGSQIYSCGYTLKYIEPTWRPKQTSSWSRRQSSVVYRGVDQHWVLISPSTSMQLKLHRYMQELCNAKSCNSFTVHILFIGAAMTYWKPYLAHLTKETNDQVNRIVATEFGDEMFNLLTVEDRQQFRRIEDRITDMFAMLDSTLDIVTSLEEKYHIFHLDEPTVSLQKIKKDINAFMLHEQHRKLNLIRKQLEALHQRVQSSVQLLSSLLDLENGRSLQKLAEESRAENVAMRKLSEKSQTDGAAVKVITIITMIYLPTTAVTNFFSTQFVHSQSNGSSGHVGVSNDWWILIAVSLPLTLFTFAVWWLLQHQKQCLNKIRQTVKYSNNLLLIGKTALYPKSEKQPVRTAV